MTLADGKVHPLATPTYDRSNPYSCVLADGRLLVVSGTGTGIVALPDGGALIVAGSDQVDTYTDVVERWSPSTGRWARMAPLPDKRDGHTTTLLDSAAVLVVGGENANSVRADTYTYDLTSDSWSPADGLTKPRSGHVAVLITDGRLLVIGGSSDGSCEILE